MVNTLPTDFGIHDASVGVLKGVILGIAPQAQVVDLTHHVTPHVSRVFHGRDVFAPAAAHPALGVPRESLGTRRDTLESFTGTRPVLSPDCIVHVVTVDVFGSVYLDSTEDMVGAGEEFKTDIDGSGRLEIAARNGHAVRRFGLRVRDTISRRRKTPRIT